MSNYGEILKGIHKGPERRLNDHILLIDGMNTLIRNFSQVKMMNPQGYHIGGLVGFLKSVGYLVRILDPTRVIVVWDGKGGSTNRKYINPEYKAHRQHAKVMNWGMYDTKEDELQSMRDQKDRILDYLEYLPVTSLELEKLEADDIIAYLAQGFSSKGKKVTIVSSDRDFLQLVDEHIEIYSPVRKITFTSKNIKEELGVSANNYHLVKALLGDASDGLRGVKGVGMKTILSEFPDLIQDEKKSLDYIYEVCSEKIGKKLIFSKIISDWNIVKSNLQLMDLHETVLDVKEKDFILEQLKREPPKLQTGQFLTLMERDKIEGIVKNMDAWFQTFQGLTLVK